MGNKKATQCWIHHPQQHEHLSMTKKWLHRFLWFIEHLLMHDKGRILWNILVLIPDKVTVQKRGNSTLNHNVHIDKITIKVNRNLKKTTWVLRTGACPVPCMVPINWHKLFLIHAITCCYIVYWCILQNNSNVLCLIE